MRTQLHGALSIDRADVQAGSWPAEPRDFVRLLKPRVMSLVVFTGLVGMVLAPGQLHPTLAFTALLCIAVGAGASGAINMWYDRDIDQRMARTAQRPIPLGRVSPDAALGFGIVLAVSSVAMMGLTINPIAALLLATTIAFYVFVYTMWLKRRTPQNIVIGGAAGALPPVIGWAAVTGDVSFEPVILFAIIFLWTPPHFWALALYRKGEYADVGVPMLPVVAGEIETRRQILLYSVAVAAAAMVPWVVGLSGLTYGVGAAALNVVLLRCAWAVWCDHDGAVARRLFGWSIVYLFLIFVLLLVDRFVGPTLSGGA